MGIVAIPKVWATTDVLTATDLNLLNSAIYNEFNGNIDNANIKTGANIDAAKLADVTITSAKLLSSVITNAKLDYTSVLVLRIGPNFPGANGKRIATGTKAITFTASASQTVTITFSSEADDGNPSFAAAPRVSFSIRSPSGSFFNPRITSILASTFTVVISTSGVITETVDLYWTAVGNA